MDLAAFGKKMLLARVAAGMSQLQLAHACGVHQSMISDTESGKRLPTIPQWVQLAKILRTSISSFVEEKSSQPQDASYFIAKELRSIIHRVRAKIDATHRRQCNCEQCQGMEMVVSLLEKRHYEIEHS